MTLGDLLTIFLIMMGICLLVMAILSLAKRKMTEPFCLAWAIVSVLLVICGILIEPSELERYVSLRIFDLSFSYNDWSGMDSLVHKHTAFNLDEKESGTGNADIPS